jgi:prepilin-type N-terminal cleavage/methylation domain-containing protein
MFQRFAGLTLKDPQPRAALRLPWALIGNRFAVRPTAAAWAYSEPRGRTSPTRRAHQGLTLAELLVVVAVLAVVGTLVLPAVGNYLSQARSDVTRQSLARLREVIGVYWQDRVQLVGGQRQNALPQPNPNVLAYRAVNSQFFPQLAFLFWNPNDAIPNAYVDYDPTYRVGWRGPYLVNGNTSFYQINATTGFLEQYGENGDPVVLDGWGNPIVVQNPGLAADGVSLDVRLVSAGPDGVVNTPPGKATLALTATDIGDDVWTTMELR